MKLKYSFMSFSCPHANLDELLAMAKCYGYDGVEPRIEAGHAHGIEPNISAQARQQIRQKALDAEVALCCIATSVHFANPTDTAEHLDNVRRCIDLAGDLGVPCLRVFGGALPKGLRREDAINLVARSLNLISSQAAQRSVIVCLETHDDWCNPMHVAEVMKRASHPSIAVNWDIMHPVRQGGSTMDQACQILKPWIKHVHFHDGLNKTDPVALKPIGQGNIDHRRAVQLLEEINFDGYLSGEWIGWEPPEVHLPRELATMKSYEG
ncbi:MAG TPA: sugar phosphate isomerase/epimerase family protein [Anaerolineae bacterium]